MLTTLAPPDEQAVNGHPRPYPPGSVMPQPAPAAPPALAPAPAASSKPPFMLTVIALLGAGLSFNAVRLMAEPFAGFAGGIATALLFDAGMWLSARWYIKTVRDGRPLRPALWLSLALVAVTLAVNIAPAHTFPERIVHGIGPALFAAFTWLEAALVLRDYRKSAGVRDRVPVGYALAHPARAIQVTVMMLGSGEKSFGAAKAMCQNREAQRRSWKTDHRPRWVAFLVRTLRPGWRGKVDPVLYTAYRWGAFDTSALILPSLGSTRPGQTGGQPSATTRPESGQTDGQDTDTARPEDGQTGGQPSATKRPVARPRSGQDTATKVATFAAKHPDMPTNAMAAKLGLSQRTVRRYRTATA
jgi:hypothetical protein